MAKIEQFSRIINHAISTSGAVFTVPTSNDHTDETWLATDLYVGEFGVNVTDDKVYVRTSNGIVQLTTGSTNSTAGSNILIFNSPNIQIASTYSASSLSPNGTYYTDLGASSIRWKDLYIGGSSTTVGTINANGSLVIKEASKNILTTNGAVNADTPIEIDGNSTNTKTRTLALNSKGVTASGTMYYNTTISSQNVIYSNNVTSAAIGATDVTFDSGLSNVVHLGRGYNRTNKSSDQVVVGGSLAIRGTADDTSTQYNQSDWVTKQSKLRTSNALMTDLATIPWSSTASGGDIVQVKAHVLASHIADATLVYSAEISGVYSLDAGLVQHEIGIPIVSEWCSFSSGYEPTVEIGSDATGVRIKAQGNGSNTIQWLCTYSYHRLINVI